MIFLYPGSGQARKLPIHLVAGRALSNYVKQSRVRTPPNFLIYQPAWSGSALGVFFLILVPIQRTWQPLVAGVGFLIFGVLFAATAAWWRYVYDDLHPEDRARGVDHFGFQISRVELATDALATRIVRLVWSNFLPDR